MSRVTIMSVSRALSEIGIAKYAVPKPPLVEFLTPDRASWSMYIIPNTASAVLATSFAVSLRKAGVLTQRNDVHQTEEGDDPVAHGTDNVATI